MNRILKYILIGVLTLLSLSASFADEVTKEQIKGLDEQVQDIKPRSWLRSPARSSQLNDCRIWSKTRRAGFKCWDSGIFR